MSEYFVEPAFSPEVFRFSGQATLEPWTFTELFEENGWRGYDLWLSHEPELFLLRVRELADAFPTWQRHATTGRPAIDERTHVIAAMLRQTLNATFRQLESWLRVLGPFFRIEHVPDANTLSEKNRSNRFTTLLRRFHQFILAQLPARDATVATDATGYSNRKTPWRETDYGLRATQNWVKSTAVVEVPQLLYHNSVQTSGRPHDSRMFEPAWREGPANVRVRRSLADGAFTSERCLQVAIEHGATPLHDVRANARHTAQPETAYEKLVNFATHWPERFRTLTAPRKLIETAFNCTKQRFGHQLRTRTKAARRNDVQSKETAHNVRMIIARETILSG